MDNPAGEYNPILKPRTVLVIKMYKYSVLRDVVTKQNNEASIPTMMTLLVPSRPHINPDKRAATRDPKLFALIRREMEAAESESDSCMAGNNAVIVLLIDELQNQVDQQTISITYAWLGLMDYCASNDSWLETIAKRALPIPSR
jgi:hypothetical protein